MDKRGMKERGSGRRDEGFEGGSVFHFLFVLVLTMLLLLLLLGGGSRSLFVYSRG